MRLYVAGPMSGHTDWNHPAFHEAEAQLVAAGYEVVNPAHTGADATEDPLDARARQGDWSHYLRLALLAMLGADGAPCEAIAVLPGWRHSVGARLEVHVGKVLGWDVHPVSFWIEAATTR